MSPPKVCCNPFNIKGHNSCYKNLVLITENCNEKLSVFYNKYVCVKCKTKLYKKKSDVKSLNKNLLSKRKIEESIKNVPENDDYSSEEMESEIHDENYVSVRVDKNSKKVKLVKSIENVILSSTKSEISNKDLQQSLLEVIQPNLNDSLLCSSIEINNFWITDLKNALIKAPTKREKTFLLTTLPVQWSIRKTAREFGVSRRMVSTAFNIRKNNGFAIEPDKKSGRSMSEQLKNKIKNFFLSDDVSRMMPGAKDYKSIVVNGKREHQSVSF